MIPSPPLVAAEDILDLSAVATTYKTMSWPPAVRPGGSGSDPLINNIGAHVNVVPASRAFYSSPAVKYYTPQ